MRLLCFKARFLFRSEGDCAEEGGEEVFGDGEIFFVDVGGKLIYTGAVGGVGFAQDEVVARYAQNGADFGEGGEGHTALAAFDLS